MYEVNYLFSLLIPSIFLITFLVASVKKVRVYDSFTEGMKGAIPLIVSIFPYIAAVTMLSMFLEVSGFGERLNGWLAPLYSLIGIPQELAPLLLIKPLSGSGSIAVLGELLEKYGHPTAEALVESAFEHLELLEKQGFYDTCVSMKSSTVPTMVKAARLFRERCDYPIHIGVTETGPVKQGLIKSAMGIGALLLDGIGDTIRVSLTDDPVEEVYAAKDILKAAGLRKEGVNIISCPTCGRTRIDLIGLVNQVDAALKNCEKPITVAVMGCIVNGPGEAREADIGIAGGDGWGTIFEKGVQVEKLPYDELLPALLARIERM